MCLASARLGAGGLEPALALPRAGEAAKARLSDWLLVSATSRGTLVSLESYLDAPGENKTKLICHTFCICSIAMFDASNCFFRPPNSFKTASTSRDDFPEAGCDFDSDEGCEAGCTGSAVFEYTNCQRQEKNEMGGVDHSRSGGGGGGVLRCCLCFVRTTGMIGSSSSNSILFGFEVGKSSGGGDGFFRRLGDFGSGDIDTGAVQ